MLANREPLHYIRVCTLVPLLSRVSSPNASRQVRKISRSLSRLFREQIEMCVLGPLPTFSPSAFGDSGINHSKLLLQMDTCRIGCCALRWRAVRCGSIVAKQGAEETSEKSNFHAGSRGRGGAARAPRTERPRALHSARRRRTGRANATRAGSRYNPPVTKTRAFPKVSNLCSKCGEYFLNLSLMVTCGGRLIKGLWVWLRPSRPWVSLSPDRVNSCSFLSLLKGDVTPRSILVFAIVFMSEKFNNFREVYLNNLCVKVALSRVQ